MSNDAQREAWDGEGGAFWADHIDHYERGTLAYRPALLDAAAIGHDDAVLDVGCGAGAVTLDAAGRAPGGSALGVDLSSRMLAIARRRAAEQGVTTATFEQLDAQVHPFAPASLDVVVSKHGSMFFADPVAAFTNLGRALRPGGRLALLTWQPHDRQEWMRRFFAIVAAGRPPFEPPTEGPSPLSLGDPERVRAILGAAGFTDVELADRREPMWYGDDVDDATSFVTAHHRGFLRDLDDATRAGVVDELRTDLAAHLTDDGVTYASACWLVTAVTPRSTPPAVAGR